MAESRIVILDFGSQYTQVIARRIRECQVYSQIVPFDTPLAEIAKLAPRGLILSGGPASVYGKKAPQPDPAIYDMGVPVLGICYGMQLLAHQLGGRVEHSEQREFGPGLLPLSASTLFAGLGATPNIWNSHGDKLTKLPRGFKATPHTDNSPYAATENRQRKQ